MSSFRGAGILFSNISSILLGRKADGNLRGMWSGIGGSLKRGEPAARGAVREVLEEIYGIHNNRALVNEILRTIPLEPLIFSHGYVVYHLNFKYLNLISAIIRRRNVRAPYYPDGIPPTTHGLINEFQPTYRSEFVELDLFPKRIEQLVAHKDIDPHVLHDLSAISPNRR